MCSAVVGSKLVMIYWILDVGIVTFSFLVTSDWYLEWLLAVAFVGGISAPLNYRWVCQNFHYVECRNYYYDLCTYVRTCI